jgi:hypothetical protein
MFNFKMVHNIYIYESIKCYIRGETGVLL